MKKEERIHAKEYKDILDQGKEHLLIDVRPKVQFGICSIPNSIHIPIEELEKRMDQVKETMKEKNVSDENGAYTRYTKKKISFI